MRGLEIFVADLAELGPAKLGLNDVPGALARGWNGMAVPGHIRITDRRTAPHIGLVRRPTYGVRPLPRSGGTA